MPYGDGYENPARQFARGRTVVSAPTDETARKHRCQHCGRRMRGAELMLAVDPWDGKEKQVCIDADACSLARREARDDG